MTTNDGDAPHDDLSSGDSPASQGEIRILLGSARSWLVSSLRAVLEPEGYALEQAESVSAVLRAARTQTPEVVIIDEGLPDCSIPELCRTLLDRALPRSVPILVYSAAFWEEAEETAAMRAGAWDVIREPIRSRLLVEKLRRMIQIRRLIEAAGGDAMAEDVSGALSLGGLFRVLGILGPLARRQGVGIGCAVLGPTVPAPDREGLAEQRSSTAELVTRHTRGSDLCAWVGDVDLALVAYGTTADGVDAIMRRLSRVDEELRGSAVRTVSDRTLSAGVTDLDPEAFLAEGGGGPDRSSESLPGGRVASLSQIAQAQAALRSARDAGGGVRAAERA